MSYKYYIVQYKEKFQPKWVLPGTIHRQSIYNKFVEVYLSTHKNWTFVVLYNIFNEDIFDTEEVDKEEIDRLLMLAELVK